MEAVTKASRVNPGIALAVLFVALVVFEYFNVNVTASALDALLGNMSFFTIKWAVILAIALCGIDFAFVSFETDKCSRLLRRVWLAPAIMNAVLVWWEFDSKFQTRGIPAKLAIIGAIIVFFLRILILGGFYVNLNKFILQLQNNRIHK